MKSPMIGCSISGDNHIRKRKSAKGLDSVATEAVSEDDAMLEGKGEKEMKWQMVNIQHFTLNDMLEGKG